MSKKKSYRAIIGETICFLLLFTSLCIAVPCPPDCVCEITAKIISIEESSVFDEYAKEKHTRIKMKIEIIDIGPMVRSGHSSDMTCDQYEIGQKMKLSLVKERHFLDQNYILTPGTIIKGNIESVCDEFSSGYRFNRIEVILVKSLQQNE
jgi:hypothetical protein